MYGDCLVGKFTSNSRGGIMMYTDNWMLTLMMLMLLKNDILQIVDDED